MAASLDDSAFSVHSQAPVSNNDTVLVVVPPAESTRNRSIASLGQSGTGDSQLVVINNAAATTQSDGAIVAPVTAASSLADAGSRPRRTLERQYAVTIAPDAEHHPMFRSPRLGPAAARPASSRSTTAAGVSGASFALGGSFRPAQRIKIIEDPELYRPSTPILNWEGPKRSLRPPRLQLWLVVTVLVTLQMILCGIVPQYLAENKTTFLAVLIPIFALSTGAIMFMSTTRHLQELTVLMQSINTPTDMDKVVERLQNGRFSRFEEPWKVQVHIIKMFCRLLKHHHGVNPLTGTFINAGADPLAFGEPHDRGSDENNHFDDDCEDGADGPMFSPLEDYPTRRSAAPADHEDWAYVYGTPGGQSWREKDLDDASMYTANESITELYPGIETHSSPRPPAQNVATDRVSPDVGSSAMLRQESSGALRRINSSDGGAFGAGAVGGGCETPRTPNTRAALTRTASSGGGVDWPRNNRRRSSGAALTAAAAAAASACGRPAIDADPLGDNAKDWTEILGDESPPTSSIILTLLGQVKVGQDLSKVVLPVHILESRSLLEKLSDLFIHPELFGAIASCADPVERLVAVSRWYISGFHMRPKGAKKPYNPILGETFECYFARGTADEIHYVAEQVSHHPPISVFCARHRASGTTLTASYQPRSKLVSPNCGASLGEGLMTLDVPGQDARYTMNWPSVYVGGLLKGPMRLEVVGEVEIKPEKSELVGLLDFTRKPMFRGDYDVLRGGISRGKTRLYTFDGKWHSRTCLIPPAPPGVKEADHAAAAALTLFDPSEHRPQRPFAPETMLPKPSRVVWRKVTRALRALEAVAAQAAKEEIETGERELRRAREARDEQYLPGYFRVARGGDAHSGAKSFWTYIGERL